MKPDIRTTPAYPFAEAAHYLNVPLSTLRAWFLGTTYRHGGAKRTFKPVIQLDGAPKDGLSFLNLVEAHVLAGIRRTHDVSLPRTRAAIDFVRLKLNLPRPALVKPEAPVIGTLSAVVALETVIVGVPPARVRGPPLPALMNQLCLLEF